MNVPRADRSESPAESTEAAQARAWTVSPDRLPGAAGGSPAARNRAVVVLATLAAVFALHWAQQFFIPLVLGMTLAFTLNPTVVWLERIKIPRLIGTSLVMLALVGTGALAMLALRGQVERILEQVPEAAGQLSMAIHEMAAQPSTIRKVQDAAREIEHATSQATEASPALQPPVTHVVVEQPRFKLADVLWTGSIGMFDLLGEAMVLLLLVFFLLLSGDAFKRKLLRVTGSSLSQRKITVSIVDDIHRSVQKYMLAMLLANILLAMLTWMTFSWIGLDNAGAWGVAAGVLHFVPYLGPAFIALATGMAAFMQFGSFGMALAVSGSSLALAALVGMVVVTWLSCKIGRMNALAVFISLLFWGWLWGAMGLLLAIPIMGMVKVIAEHFESLQPVAELLGE